ncbi:hypothetical protein ACFV4N_28855 [Actinosynnema sp. NPDC059797]
MKNDERNPPGSGDVARRPRSAGPTGAAVPVLVVRSFLADPGEP